MSRAMAAAPALLLLCAVATTALGAPRDRQGGVHGERHVVLDGYVVHRKPTAPIAVSYTLGAAPALGQPLPVRIVAHPAEGVTDVTLELTADARLHVGPLVHSQSADGAEHVWTVTVTPLEEGLGNLNVSVTGRLDGGDQTRSLLVPIRTVGARSAAVAAAEDASGDEAVISLPAEETRGR